MKIKTRTLAVALAVASLVNVAAGETKQDLVEREIASKVFGVASDIGVRLDWSSWDATGDLSLAIVRIRRAEPSERELRYGADLALAYVDFEAAGVPRGIYIVRVLMRGRTALMLLANPRTDKEYDLPTMLAPVDPDAMAGVEADCDVEPHDDGTLTKTCCATVSFGPFSATGCLSATAGEPVE